MNSNESTADMLRLVGIMAVCVGMAWALQILGLGAEGPALSRLMWVVGAATIAGAGVGAICTAASLRLREVSVRS